MIRDPFDMLLWVYPHMALDDAIDYEVESEADHQGVRIMVARDGQSVPHAIAVAVGGAVRLRDTANLVRIH